MLVSEETYRRVVLDDPTGGWELVCGRLRQKPIMTTEHEDVALHLVRRLVLQLPEDEYAVGQSMRLRVSTGSYYVPDVCVVPRMYVRRLRERPGTFAVYTDPVPFVGEVWSPSTGEYDVDTKIPEYRLRCDQEIWRLHPYEHTLIAWRLQPDGTYTESHYTGGTVHPAFLPSVAIDLDTLFD
jgi:Uma2 family endonuclease